MSKKRAPAGLPTTSPAKRKKRPDLVKPSKTPRPVRERALWVHNPDKMLLDELMSIADDAHAEIPWERKTKGETRVKAANDVAVEHKVHREVVYILRRGRGIFGVAGLRRVLKQIGLHRLSVLLLAHERARELFERGVPDPFRASKRRKAVAMYRTEELRRAVRAYCGDTKRAMVPGGSENMAVVRGPRFRKGPLKDNFDRLLLELDAGFQQGLRRATRPDQPARQIKEDGKAFEHFCEELKARCERFPERWQTAKTEMVDKLQNERSTRRAVKPTATTLGKRRSTQRR